MTTTIHCPLCDWTYTVPPLPAGINERALADAFGPGVMLQAMTQRAVETETNLQAHFQSHSLPTWVRKVTELQAQIETQKAKLAMLREKEAM